MNFYYLKGSGFTPQDSPGLWVLGVAVMGLLTISVGFAVGLAALRKWREIQWSWCTCQANMRGKVVVITGGNSGIGLETARALAAKGAVVVLACRDAGRAQQAISDIRKTISNGDLIFLELDLANPESIKVFVSRLLTKFKRVDVLINNAGVYYPPQNPPVTTIEGVEIHFAVNHLGHFLLTHLLTETLVATPESRIVVVSSELYKSGRVDVDNLVEAGYSVKSSRQPLYNNSKLANLLHARELHNRLKSRGVLVCALSPGFVYSGLFRHSLQRLSWFRKLAFLPIAFFFMRSTVQGAQTSIHCACSKEVTLDSGRAGAPYYSNCLEKPLLPVAKDDEAAKKLWEGSVRMLRL